MFISNFPYLTDSEKMLVFINQGEKESLIQIFYVLFSLDPFQTIGLIL